MKTIKDMLRVIENFKADECDRLHALYVDAVTRAVRAEHKVKILNEELALEKQRNKTEPRA